MQRFDILILQNGEPTHNSNFDAEKLPYIVTYKGRAFERIPGLEGNCYHEVEAVEIHDLRPAKAEEPQPGESENPVDAMVNEGGLTHD